MRKISLSHEYAFPAQDVWEVAIDYECLEEVMQGLVTFQGLPTGQVAAGQSITVMVSLFGKLPAQPYKMDVLDFDAAGMTFTSAEQGAGVKSWRHRLLIEPTDTGCRLSETIEIDAGWATGLFALWARFLYAKRHQPRLRILARRRDAV